VAGVQLESRQHSLPSAFFQTSVPSALRQLSAPDAALNSAAVGWAKTAIGAASAIEAISIAALFSFFMVVLSRNAAVAGDMSKIQS
jgi:hypothetical protein